MKTIGLCMIVKNEAPVILRCLKSVHSLIDYALIVDTGSTDATETIVLQYLAEQRLPGGIYAEPWRGFALNRTSALARLREQKQIDYALVMDADDVIVLPPKFDIGAFKASLDKDYYHIELRTGPRDAPGSVRFWRPQILSNRRDFAYKGVLHEFVAAPREASAFGVLTELFIAVGNDGIRSRNPQQYRDDALTLEKALETEKDEAIRARYLFYLGQSWKNAGEKEKALAAFLRRSELGFFKEEAALSLYYAAQIKDSLGHSDTEIIGTFLKAYEADPLRIEALHGAMDYCRRNHKPYLGYLIGKHAIGMAEPAGRLFDAPWIYDYGALEEFSVLAYHSGHFQACIDAIRKLLADGRIPESAHARLQENARVAAENLAAAKAAPAPAAAATV
jgi:glycosyltransferase involved in cell wall biosynthesis